MNLNGWCHIIAEEFKFEIRELIHFRELIKQTIYISDDFLKNTNDYLAGSNRKEGTLNFLNFYFTPLAVAFLLSDINEYYSFINGENQNFINIMMKHIESIGYYQICYIIGTENSPYINEVAEEISSKIKKII